MKESNDLDNLFLEGLQKDFPVDENLWQQAESQISGKESKKGFWLYLNSLAILAIVGMSLMLKSDHLISQKYNGTTLDFNLDNSTVLNDIESSYFSSNSHMEALDNKNVQKTAFKTPVNSNESGKINFQLPPNPAKSNEKINSSKVEKNKRNHPFKKSTNSIKNNKTLGVEKKTLNPPKIGLLGLSPKGTKEFSNLVPYEDLYFIEPRGQFMHEKATALQLKQAETRKVNKLQSRFHTSFLEFEISYAQSLTIKKALDGLSEEQKNYRRSSEKSLQQNQYGFSVFSPYKFLHFGLGLHYSKFEERANYDVSYLENGIDVRFDTTYRILNSNYTNNGIPVILIQEEINRVESSKTIESQRKLSVQNQISRIQLPISVGYRQNLGRWQAGLRSSFIVNYLSHWQGAYISDERNQLLQFSEINQFNTIVYSQQNQFNLGYVVNEFIAIGTSLRHTYDINSFTKQYESKLNHYDLGVWVRFQPQ